MTVTIELDGNTYRVLVESIRPVRSGNEYDCDAWKLQPSGRWHPVRNWDRLDQLAKIAKERPNSTASHVSPPC